ncbi:hypothetical protein ACFX1W_023074 [Malus domestica]
MEESAMPCLLFFPSAATSLSLSTQLNSHERQLALVVQTSTRSHTSCPSIELTTRQMRRTRRSKETGQCNENGSTARVVQHRSAGQCSRDARQVQWLCNSHAVPYMCVCLYIYTHNDLNSCKRD